MSTTATETGIPGAPSGGSTDPGPSAGGIPGGTPDPSPTGNGGVVGPSGSQVPTPTPTPTSTSNAPANGSTGGAALSPGELAVLRKIATDADFRLQFATDPIGAITGADLKVTTQDFERLEKFDSAQLAEVATGIQALAGAGAMASGLRAEGTNTLVYAIVVALLLA